MNRLSAGRAAWAHGPGALGVVSLVVGAALAPVSASVAADLFSAKAVATIRSCGEEPLSGFATLKERASEEGIKQVDVYMQVDGIPSGKRAVHIHENASCEPCGDAGGHFDPGPAGNSSPDGNHPYHSGDLPNIESRDGAALLTTRTSRVTLSPGPLSLFDQNGSAFIVHVNPDSYCFGGEAAGCAGGARAACGIIEAVDTIDDFELMVSTRSARELPTLLSDAELSDSAYVFLSPEYPSTPVESVEFFVDGRSVKTETAAPYDLLGSRDSGRRGTRLDTRNLGDGRHVVSAVINLAGGEQTFVSSQFTVDDDGNRFLNGSENGQHRH